MLDSTLHSTTGIGGTLTLPPGLTTTLQSTISFLDLVPVRACCQVAEFSALKVGIGMQQFFFYSASPAGALVGTVAGLVLKL